MKNEKKITPEEALLNAIFNAGEIRPEEVLYKNLNKIIQEYKKENN